VIRNFLAGHNVTRAEAVTASSKEGVEARLQDAAKAFLEIRSQSPPTPIALPETVRLRQRSLPHGLELER
jgi:hypothetical protein